MIYTKKIKAALAKPPKPTIVATDLHDLAERILKLTPEQRKELSEYIRPVLK
jgi:hypothetical protein